MIGALALSLDPSELNIMLFKFYRHGCTVDYSLFQKLNCSPAKVDLFLVLAYIVKGQFAEQVDQSPSPSVPYGVTAELPRI